MERIEPRNSFRTSRPKRVPSRNICGAPDALRATCPRCDPTSAARSGRGTGVTVMRRSVESASGNGPGLTSVCQAASLANVFR